MFATLGHPNWHAARMAVGALVLLLLTGCAATRTQVAQAPVEQADIPSPRQTWQLVAMQGKAVSRTDNLVSLVLNAEAGTLNGQCSCNAYTAPLQLDSRRGQCTMAVGAVQTAGTICPEGSMNMESRYLALLAKADRLSMTPLTLTLWQKGKPILDFELR